MASMTFVIDDQSTGGNAPKVQVTITELGDGRVKIELIQLKGVNFYLGDLRGFFFDVANGVKGLEAYTVGADDQNGTRLSLDGTGIDSVKSAGDSSNNMNGLLGEAGGFDYGLEIGSEGIGAGGDDIRSFSFILEATEGDLTLSDFATSDFGVRIMSIGQDRNGDGTIDTSRNGSAKVIEHSATVASSRCTVSPFTFLLLSYLKHEKRLPFSCTYEIFYLVERLFF